MNRFVSISIVLAVTSFFHLSASRPPGNQEPAGSSSVQQSSFLPVYPSGIPASGGHGQTSAATNMSQEDRIASLRKNAIPVRSIDAEDANFADLEPLRRVIGNRRVVMLGEITHGDGAVFAAKTRLVKFLHERLGFDVLALEGGFYDVHKVWSTLRAGEEPTATMRSGLFKDGGDTRQMQTLWRYVVERSKSTRPLELAGFDLQFTGRASREYLVNDLYDYLVKADVLLDTAGLAYQVSGPLTRLMNNLISFQHIMPEDRAAILMAMDNLGRALGRILTRSGQGKAERDFWIQLLKSSTTMLELGWRVDLDSLQKTPVDWSIFNLRDRQMGENFLWLAKQAYSTRKIIVWAATSHIIRNRHSFTNENDPTTPMGDWIDKAMGPEVYTLGFTAYRGRWGEVTMSQPIDVKVAAENSLEDLFFKANFEFAWLDFRNLAADALWLREPLSSRPLRYEPKMADWTQVMDGMFFIREMFPSTRIDGNRR